MSRNNDDTTDLSEFVKFSIDQYMIENMNTCLPGIVEEFDENKQLLTVQPAAGAVFVNDETGEDVETFEPLPLCLNVIPVFVGGGGFTITHEIKKGDHCLLIFSQRSITDFYEQATIKRSTEPRKFDMSDAFAIMGIRTKKNKIQSYTNSGVSLRNDDGGTAISLIDGRVDINASIINLLGNVNVMGDVTASGEVSAGGVGLISHVHPITPGSSAGTTGAGQQPPPP